MASSDTIFALSSGGTPSGVAVIRLSGPQAFEIAGGLCAELPHTRHMSLRSIRDRNGLVLDRCLVLTFPGPASFTGEDCVEFQLHGSRAVVAAVEKELAALGCRYAEAGEFTQRAFDNGKLDLVEVEGLGDLIAADTEMQRRLAMEQMSGGLSKLYSVWAERLTHARAMIEAELDFADEEDIPGSVSDRIWPDLEELERDISRQIEATQKSRSVRDGFNVVISGPPNAGKSSFLNLMAGRDAAIVTDIAGTTRDIIEVDLDLDGFLVKLIDTAGVRDTVDPIEQEGVRRAIKAVEQADLVLMLNEIDSETEWFPAVSNAPVIRVGTKADLYHDRSGTFDVLLSVKTGLGLEDIRQRIITVVRDNWQGISALGAGRLRHIGHLQEASNFLAEALRGSDLVLRAECLRLASDALGRITGRVDVEDMLGIIFSEFCVGK